MPQDFPFSSNKCQTSGNALMPLIQLNATVTNLYEIMFQYFHNIMQNLNLHESMCRMPLFEECSQHYVDKGNSKMMHGTYGAIDERAQVILMSMKAPGRWKHLPPTETRSHKG